MCRNAANGITLFGILLCFASQVVIYVHPQWIIPALIYIAILVIVSDAIDGPVARYFENNGYKGSISNIGKFLDRFRDKIFQFTFLFFLIWHPKVAYGLKWAFSLLVISEFILLATLFMGAKRKANVAAGDWGKRKMILECATILACLLNLVAQDHGIRAFAGVNYFLTAIALISLGLAFMSIKGHLVDLRPQPSC